MGYVAISAICGRDAKKTVVQFRVDGTKKAAVGCSCFIEGAGGAESEVLLNGELTIAPDYKGCVHCHAKYLYQCADCGAMVCYDGRAGKRECPQCFAESFVPAVQNNRVMRSGAEKITPPANVLLMFDVSGSMRTNNALEQAKKAAVDNFIAKLPDTFSIGIGYFGTDVVLTCPPTRNHDAARRAVNELFVSGETKGPIRAIEKQPEFQSFLNSKEPRYLVVLTDGRWRDESTNVNAANRLKEDGVVIIGMGFGKADKEFLKSISTRGGSIRVEDGANGIGAGFASAVNVIVQ